MWYTWTALLLVSCALVQAEGEAVKAEGEAVKVGGEAVKAGGEAVKADEEAVTEEIVLVATTRAPPRTLDRGPGDLLWKSWLESTATNSQNAPPRRITTKSLFITPLVCPNGQRLDRHACVNTVIVDKEEHERILLEKLSSLFTTPPNNGQLSIDVSYDYSDETGPYQFTLPIESDPQAAPLQGQDPYAQAQELQPNYVKKDGNTTDGDAVKAELELVGLANAFIQNGTAGSDILSQNLLTNVHNYPDKPKRDSPILNATEEATLNSTSDVGQKELVYGHVNVDPVLYDTENHKNLEDIDTSSKSTAINNSKIALNEANNEPKKDNSSTIAAIGIKRDNKTDQASKHSTTPLLKKDSEQSKLNPENDYSDIGEAIKLISRYADVTTDDNYAKEQNNYGLKEDSILGTRTKAQYRRNKPKEQHISLAPGHVPLGLVKNDKTLPQHVYPRQTGVYYRYPWSSQNSPTPPPNYPFRHLQDYWPGRNQIGGVYDTHENPRRHHHSYPHNFRLHSYPHASFGVPPAYPEQLKGYIHRVVQHHANAMRTRNTDNQDLYSLLGLRHWFSSEGTSKR